MVLRDLLFHWPEWVVNFKYILKVNEDFLAGLVVNPPTNAEDMDSIPGLEDPSMLWSN